MLKITHTYIIDLAATMHMDCFHGFTKCDQTSDIDGKSSICNLRIFDIYGLFLKLVLHLSYIYMSCVKCVLLSIMMRNFKLYENE